ACNVVSHPGVVLLILLFVAPAVIAEIAVNGKVADETGAPPSPAPCRAVQDFLVAAGEQEEIGNDLPAFGAPSQPATQPNSILGAACFPPARLLLPGGASAREALPWPGGGNRFFRS